MSAFVLKIVAVLSMTVDHIGEKFYFHAPQLFQYFRMAGRLAFPIYCFLLVEGLFHTRSREKYLGRLALFAVVSEPVFDLFNYDTLFYLQSQNVFFTLTISLLMLMVLDKWKKWWVWIPAIYGAMWVAYLAMCDYTYKGVLLVLVFYVLKNYRPLDLLAAGAANLLAFQRIKLTFPSASWYLVPRLEGNLKPAFYLQDTAILALPLLACYNGERGKYSLKYFFYAYYPLHLLALFIVGRMVG